MSHINILDCTLRDGGYCNQWNFGFDNSRIITSNLVESGIDIIECGFLTEKVPYDPDHTKYNTVEQIVKVIPENRKGKIFVVMMNYGEYDIDHLPACDGKSIDGIRVAFHKKDLVPAMELCTRIKEKGYLVFIQAMVSLSYSDEEFLSLIRKSNELKPYAFYIVDSFGVMKRKDLVRLFYMVEHDLSDDIKIGFHSHNNMQLAYSNAQTLVDMQTRRNLIIDSSIYGMGRGAGNLNTELFVEYLNDNTGSEYKVKPLLNVIDEILEPFHQQHYWGYSLPNYLSAKYNTHPNYAGFLADKNTLTVHDMDEIFEIMDDSKRNEFDKKYAEEIYLKYLSTGHVQEQHLADLKKLIAGKKILLIAPGKSSTVENEKVVAFMQRSEVVTFSINFDYPFAESDFIFLSNLRRFKELDPAKKGKCVVTSNIPADSVYLQTKYRDLLNSHEVVQDNAGMMAIRFLANLGATEFYLAGMDGYSHDVMENYGSDRMALVTRNAVLDEMNQGMQEVLNEYSKTMNIHFLTAPKYIVLGES